jgi:hypothetical protein
MTEMRELIDAELDAVCGAHHHHHGHGGHGGYGGQGGLSGFANFGNIIIEPNIAVQIGLAIGGSVTQVLGQLNFSSII